MGLIEAGTAIAICGMAARLEAFLSGPQPFAFLKALRQPAWSLPAPAWIAVGVAFYAIMAIVLARLFMVGRAAMWGVALTMIVLLADAFWNFLFFRLRRFDLAYWYLFPYSAIVVGSAIAAYAVDAVSAGLIALYVAFLPYDVAWVNALRRLNPQYDGTESKRRIGTGQED